MYDSSNRSCAPHIRLNAERKEWMSKETNRALLDRWLELWSGNLAVADEIVGPGFVGHFPPTTSRSNEIHGSVALQEWIQMTLALFTNVQLTLESDPVVDANKIVGRWLFRGAYTGGLPGATAPVGTQIAFNGIDMLRIANAKIVEYWVCSDGMYLMQQLGVLPPA
jgi:predicted ester cyclase